MNKAWIFATAASLCVSLCGVIKAESKSKPTSLLSSPVTFAKDPAQLSKLFVNVDPRRGVRLSNLSFQAFSPDVLAVGINLPALYDGHFPKPMKNFSSISIEYQPLDSHRQSIGALYFTVQTADGVNHTAMPKFPSSAGSAVSNAADFSPPIKPKSEVVISAMAFTGTDLLVTSYELIGDYTINPMAGQVKTTADLNFNYQVPNNLKPGLTTPPPSLPPYAISIGLPVGQPNH